MISREDRDKLELEDSVSERPQGEGGIRIIHNQREYVLSAEDVKRHRRWVEEATEYDPETMLSSRSREADSRENFDCFKNNVDGLVLCYGGTFVAYYNGVLCGQSHDGSALYNLASKLYDETNRFKSSGLAVFKVPAEVPSPEAWENLKKGARGSF